RFLPRLRGAGRNDLAGVVELELVPGTEIAGQDPEGELEAFRPVYESRDAGPGARGVALSEGSGHLAQILDRVGNLKAEAVQPVLPDQYAVTGHRLLEGDAVQVAIDTRTLDCFLLDLRQVRVVGQMVGHLPEQARGRPIADGGHDQLVQRGDVGNGPRGQS